MQEIFDLVTRLGVDASVLVTGESGTGKELIARAIHFNSPRRRSRSSPVNVAAIPETLIESELFGYKRGAFTDARTDHAGLFSRPTAGPSSSTRSASCRRRSGQAPARAAGARVRPLGRPVGEDRRARGGGDQPRARVALRAGQFREDLYYRLNVIHIAVPPLRARVEDILPLPSTSWRRRGGGGDEPGEDGVAVGGEGPARLPVAGQRARAGERHRARAGAVRREQVGVDDLPRR
jgi:two-component system response regulator HydG